MEMRRGGISLLVSREWSTEVKVVGVLMVSVARPGQLEKQPAID